MAQFRMNDAGIAPGERRVGGIPKMLVRIAIGQAIALVVAGLVLNALLIAIYGWRPGPIRVNFVPAIVSTVVAVLLFLMSIARLTWLNISERLAKRRRLAARRSRLCVQSRR